MATSKYIDNGVEYWQVYVNIRSNLDPTVRYQSRRKGLESEKAALLEEKKLIRKLTESVAQLEGRGLTWGSIIDQWEDTMLSDPIRRLEPMTIADYVSALRRWTECWLKIPGNDLTRGDGRDIINQMETQGCTKSLQKRVRNIVNIVFDWAVEYRLLRNAQESPMRGLKVDRPKSEAIPEILNLDQIRKLLQLAHEEKHSWGSIWTMALLTGMRNGELHALTWGDVDFKNEKITVSKSYNTRTRTTKCTKAGTWRTVPISADLMQLLISIKGTSGNHQHVLPRFPAWDKGEQARVLRSFCVGHGLPSIRFHALRACFATQLLAHDIAPARVMKVCGWKDLKTMQHYIRLAGIDEKGATDVLKLLPTAQQTVETIANLFDFERK